MNDLDPHPQDNEPGAPLAPSGPALALTASPRLQTVRSPLPAKDPAAEREPSSGGGLTGYLHAFRRRWPLAVTLGVLGGLAAAAACWFSTPIKYTASALIRISADNPKKVFKIDDVHSSFDVYKGTQIQLLKSDFVLAAALREVPNAAVLNQEDDRLRFLGRTLQVDSPPNGEIITVSFTAPDGKEAALIVQKVVDAYMNEIVDKEKGNRKKHIDELTGFQTEKEGEIRSRWEQLKGLMHQVGIEDKGAQAIQQQLAMQQVSQSMSDLNRLQSELQRANAALAAKSLLLKARQNGSAETIDLDVVASADPTCDRLQQELADLDYSVAEVVRVYKPSSGALKTKLDELARVRRSIEDRLATRRQQLAARLKSVKPPEGPELEIKYLKGQVDTLKEDMKEAEKAVARHRQEAERLGVTSVDVEMTQSQIQSLERALVTIGNELLELKVEQDSELRIKDLPSAPPPSTPDKSSRLQNTITLGLFGFLAPVGLLLWWDLRGRRINSIRDVSDGLGLTVIGTVPRISTGGGKSGRGLRRRRQMQMCLDHSIDGIAAKLFLRRDSGGARVVLVSSATHGEGKSTLAIQLAKRLARTGARTLLVDFDLRKPSLHQVFDAPRGPGLTEFLRGSSDLAPLIRPTDLDNLSILTAGSPFADSLGTLSNGVTRSLFDKARGDFDFVIVDGSPILPVVDALLTSQHVDAVVLSVRRDVSQADRVRAACAQLEAFGVEQYVAVLTGTSEDLYYYGNQELVTPDGAHRPR